MSAEETILNLFDTHWFEQSVFTSRSSLSTSANPPLMQEQADQDNPNPKLNRITTLMRRSYSDQFLSSKGLSSSESSSPSPTSVLAPHLQTILSGKEVESFDDESSLPKEADIISGNKYINSEKNRETDDRRREIRVRERRRRRKKSASKSLTELEVQELKGFMDLGFVFSDEDKDSRLVSIIPGLQRLGKTVQESGNNVRGVDETTTTSVSRPYLSEAWDCCREGGEEREREKNPLMDWRIPAFGNEMELKDHLKFWAHTVASTVR